MKTRREISTISYNTVEFLTYKLNDLLDRHIISFWSFITHYPEEDEKKEHHHVYMRPNGQLDTMDLQLEFRELDPNNPKKPKGCIDFHVSKIDDWIPYNEHNPTYLAFKFESRKYHYNKSNFYTSDPDTFDFYYHQAFYCSDWAKEIARLQKINDPNVSPAELVRSGVIPLKQAANLNALYYMENHYTARNGRPNHEDNEFNT